MERQDLELIKKYIDDDTALRRLYEEHQDLERKLDGLSQKFYLTAEEEIERARLKKIKLKGRDQIEHILRKYREREKTA